MSEWMLLVIGAGALFLVAYLNNGTRLLKQSEGLSARIDELTKRVFTLQDGMADCQKGRAEGLSRERDLKTDLEHAQHRLEALESAAGIVVPTAAPGVVIANAQGVIQEFSPSLTAALGWTSDEMRGQNILKLVPDDLKEEQQAAFTAAAKPGVFLDPLKRINTYALDKNGRRIPVVIAVRKWSGPEGLITATVQMRPSAVHVEGPGPAPTLVKG